MPRQSSKSLAKKGKPKPRKFYTISYSLRHGLADFEVENLDVLCMGARVLGPPEGGRGFPIYPEMPRVVIGKRRKGPPPSAIELFHHYWLISDGLKRLFESLDADAFAFQPCDVTLRDGSPGPTHWLCHVVRVIEAFGEKTMDEIEAYRRQTGVRRVSSIYTENLVFNEEAIGSARIFRTPYSDLVFCDQSLKDACKAAGLKGIAFRDCFPKGKRVTPPPPSPLHPQGSKSLHD